MKTSFPIWEHAIAVLIYETGLLPVDYSFTLIDVQLPYMNMQSIFKGFLKL